MKIYRYRSLGAWGSRIMGMVWIVFPILFLTKAWYDFLSVSPAAMPIGKLFPLSFVMLFALVGGMVVLNLFSDVAVRDNGLSVGCFLIVWLFVPWEDVFSVKPSLASVSGNIYLVKVKKLTFVYNLISLTQGFSLRPGFLVAPGIEGQKELLQTIREHVRSQVS